MTVLDYLRELNIVSMMLRIILAMVAGGLVGLERERKGRPAGFRTYMLVALGAAVTMLLSQYLNVMLNGPWTATANEIGIRTDVSRFGAQVINGVGFLGAGTIIVTTHREVKGLTTAAGLWASACMGIACGAGFYECVFIGFVLVILCMRFLPAIENLITANSRNMNINVEMESIEYFREILSCLRQKQMQLHDVDVDHSFQENNRQITAIISISMPYRMDHAELLAELSTIRGIVSIEEI